MLRPLGQVFRRDNAENITPLKIGAFAGVQLRTETGGAPAVGGSAKASVAQVELAGGAAVFRAQHLRLDDNDLPPEVMLVADDLTAVGGDGFVGDSLDFGAVQVNAGFLRLFRHTLPKQP